MEGEEKMAVTKIAAVLLVVGLVVGVVAGYGVGFITYQPQISQLQTDLTEAQDHIKSLETQLNELLFNFSMQVIPAHMYAIPGQRCVFLVVVTDEGCGSGKGKAVDIRIVIPHIPIDVTVYPQAIPPEQVAEVTVIPHGAANLTVTVEGERGGVRRTETVTIEVLEFRWTIEELEDRQGPYAVEVRDRFIPWLATNHPEFGITSETEWTGIIVRPLIPGAGYYLFFSEDWEMAVSWHMMIPPQDWARIYLRHRFTEACPSYAFEISSLDAQEEPHAIDPPESVWR